MENCRACLSTNSLNLQPLFTQNFSELFNSLTHLQITHDDGLPSKICLICIEKLQQYDTFKIQCVESDTVLRRKFVEIKKEKLVKKPVNKKCNNKGGEIKLEFHEVNEVQNTSNGNTEINSIILDEVEHEQFDNEDYKYDVECILTDQDSPCNEDDIKNDAISSETDLKLEDEDLDQTIAAIVANSKMKLQFYKSPISKNITKGTKKTTHPPKPYTCNICDRGFIYQERYEGHLREHDGKKPAVCEFCGGEYTAWTYLLKHMEREHKANMRFKCHCGKSFAYESGLIAHKVKHTGRSSFICETCGKAFYDSYQLKKHTLVHNSETPFSCDQCGKRFKAEYRLTSHQFRHKNIRNFKCTTCGKSFITRPELRIHMKSHSNQMEYDCRICGKLFRQKTQVSAHMRSHEGL